MILIAETPRLLLRELESADAPALHPVFSDPQATRFTLRVHSAVAETEAWINAIRMGYEKRGFAPWAVVDKSDNGLLGYCGCGVIPLDGARECEIGYRIVPSRWGRGFATEAVRVCLDYVFAKLPFSKVVALIQPANIASIRVAEKAGMNYQRDTQYEGVLMRLYDIHAAAGDNPLRAADGASDAQRSAFPRAASVLSREESPGPRSPGQTAR